MELDPVADELYDAAPEDFVALRKARAAEAKAAGDRELSKQITALRRPTRSAWIANLVARHATEDLTGLLDLGAAIAEAQQRLSGEELRRLSTQRHQAIAALVHRGVQLAEVRGHTASEATRREVSETLQAALSDPAIAADVRAGRLTQPCSYGGFGPEFAAAAASPSPPAEPAEQPPEDETGSVDADAEAEGADQHEQLVQELSLAQETLDRLGSQLERAESLADKAAETAELKAGRVNDLREQLDRAEREADRAEQDRQRLTENRDRLREEQSRAETAVSDALARLADG